MKPVCLLVEDYEFSNHAICLLSSKYEVMHFGSIEPHLVNAVEVIFVRLKWHIDEAFLTDFQNLKVICSPTTGLNHIDLDYCKCRQIQVISLNDDNAFLEDKISATAEFTWGIFLTVWRNIFLGIKDVRDGNWEREKFKSNQLAEKRVGIVGLGRVGKKVSSYANAFGMVVEYYDPYVTGLKGEVDTITNLFSRNEIIFFTCKLNQSSYHILNFETVHSLRDGAVLVNTSRGEVIDEQALISQIGKKKIRYAADVIQNETNLVESNLVTLIDKKYQNNIFITPHIAGACHDAMHLTEERIAKRLMESIC